MKEYRNSDKVKWRERILKILFPWTCPFCGELVREGMCKECRKKVVPVQEPKCKKCGKPVRSEQQEYCYDCGRTTHYFEEGRSLYVHKNPAAEAIYAMKYQNRRIYAEFFGKELAEQYGTFLMKKGINLIVPIPLHKSKKRKRGYNQAELLAKALSYHTGIPMEREVLCRKKKTEPQKKLNEKERKRNIRGAFCLLKHLEEGKVIVLIDDIYTTGSTIDEAAQALLRAGGEKVYFLTISIGQGY